MRILVNDQELDVRLEQERTVGEVVAGLGRWLSEAGLRVVDLAADGTEVSLGNDDDRTLPVERVSELRVTAVSRGEHELSALTTLVEWLDLLQRNLMQRTPETLADVLSELPHLRSTIRGLVHTMMRNEGDSSAQSALDDIASRTASGEQLSEAACETAIQKVESLRNLAVSRIRELWRPRAEAQATTRALQSELPKLAEVAVLLQTGEDREAMGRIVRFTELTEKILRVVGSELPEAGSLNSALDELMRAFADQDSVLIGDILEYDVVPAATELVDYLAESASYDRVESSPERPMEHSQRDVVRRSTPG